MNRSISYLIPTSDQTIYDEWFGQSKISANIQKLNLGERTATEILNEQIKNLSEDCWIIICEQDVKLLTNIEFSLPTKDKNCIYGIIGARLENDLSKQFDGRTGDLKINDTLVDCIGQGLLIFNSSIIKKFNLKFDVLFYNNYMIDFSLQCKQIGIPIRIISTAVSQKEKMVNYDEVEYFKKILRSKYQNILPVGLWGGKLSLSELEDLRDYVKQRDNWISILLKEKKMLQNSTLNSKLTDARNMLDVLLTKSSDEQKEKLVGKHQIIKQKNYDELEKKLVWIFGTPRSGSTWLTKDILKKESIKILDEPMIGALMGNFFDNPQIHWNLFIENYAANFTRIVDRERDDMFFSSKYEENWKQHLRILILERIAAQFGFSGFNTLIIKAPNESHASDLIMKSLPKSRLLFLIRDGRDVIDSRQSRFHNPRGGTTRPETPEERKFRIAHFAKMWNIMVSTTKRAYENHVPSRRFFLKYEELRSNPEKEIKKIFDFLGWHSTRDQIREIAESTRFENIPINERGEDKDKRKAIPGGFKNYFTDEELHIANKIMKENLLEFEYEIKKGGELADS